MAESEEKLTVNEALTEVIGTMASRIVSDENADPKQAEALATVVDSFVKANQAERETQLEYDKMDHETELEKSRARSDMLKTGATVLSVVAGVGMGIYVGETQKELLETQCEFDRACLEDQNEFEKDGIYTGQASRTVLSRLGKRMLPNLLGAISRFNFFK